IYIYVYVHAPISGELCFMCLTSSLVWVVRASFSLFALVKQREAALRQLASLPERTGQTTFCRAFLFPPRLFPRLSLRPLYLLPLLFFHRFTSFVSTLSPALLWPLPRPPPRAVALHARLPACSPGRRRGLTKAFPSFSLSLLEPLLQVRPCAVSAQLVSLLSVERFLRLPFSPALASLLVLSIRSGQLSG
ncbi:hypothetical protein TGRUB_212955, partial [Toxoplasma gondii RUB]